MSTQLIEDIAWGEYDKAWSKGSNKKVRQALITALREDFEHAHGNKLTLFFALAGCYQYYASDVMSVSQKIHYVTTPNSNDSSEIVARRACTDKPIMRRENPRPTPLGAWQQANQFGLSVCKACEKTLNKSLPAHFGPSYKANFFTDAPDAIQQAWQEMIESTLDDALDAAAGSPVDTDAILPAAAKEFAVMMLETIGNKAFLQGPLPTPSPKAAEAYAKCVATKGQDFEILDELPKNFAQNLVNLSWDTAQAEALDSLSLNRRSINGDVKSDTFVNFYYEKVLEAAIHDISQMLSGSKSKFFRSEVLKRNPPKP